MFWRGSFEIKYFNLLLPGTPMFFDAWGPLVSVENIQTEPAKDAGSFIFPTNRDAEEMKLWIFKEDTVYYSLSLSFRMLVDPSQKNIIYWKLPNIVDRCLIRGAWFFIGTLTSSARCYVWAVGFAGRKWREVVAREFDVRAHQVERRERRRRRRGDKDRAA